MRVVITAALAASMLLLSGCKKDEPRPVEPPKVEEPKVETPPAKVEPEAKVEGDGDGDGEVKLTPDHIDRYARYSSGLMTILLKFKQDMKAAGSDVAKLRSIQEQYAADEAALRSSNTLSEAEVKAANEAVGEVVDLRRLYKQGEGDKTIAEMKANLAKMPPEGKAEAEAELKTLEEGMKRMRDATDAREKYGNEIVDAILKHEAALSSQREQLLKSMD